jgi:hypothetical protein
LSFDTLRYGSSSDEETSEQEPEVDRSPKRVKMSIEFTQEEGEESGKKKDKEK